MVLKLDPKKHKKTVEFENDVKMYGTQTLLSEDCTSDVFENDVKMYGTQTDKEMDKIQI